MTRDEKEFVSVLRQGLAERIGRERYDLWFGARVRFDWNDQVLVVSARDQFILDRVRKQFLADLEAVARHVLGFSSKVELRVDPSLEALPASASESSDASSGQAAARRNPQPVAGSKSGRHNERTATRQPADLDAFVVGAGNRVAFTAARSVAERPGVFSPLFLYGPTGCGKTHLLEGVWTAVRRQSRLSRVLSLSAEQFTTCFLEALQGKGLPSFRRKCRDVDLLAIDDIQFFAGKRATLVELQHTVESLLRQGRQLVLAADRPPAALSGLGPELIARVSGGLVCGIEPADYETRLGVAKQMATQCGAALPLEVMELIAAELNGDARQIRGALNRLQASSEALQQPVTLELAKTWLADLFRAKHRMVWLPDIERAVCQVFGLEPNTLREGRRAKSTNQPRMLAMWLARKYTRAAFSEISQYFGRRSHSSVISAEKKVNRWMADGATVQVGHGTCNVEDAIRRVELQLRTG